MNQEQLLTGKATTFHKKNKIHKKAIRESLNLYPKFPLKIPKKALRHVYIPRFFGNFFLEILKKSLLYLLYVLIIENNPYFLRNFDFLFETFPHFRIFLFKKMYNEYIMIKNIFEKIKLNNIVEAFVKVFRRYPTVVFFILAIYIINLLFINFSGSPFVVDNRVLLGQLIVYFSSVTILSFGLYLFSGAHNFERKKTNLLQILPFVLIAFLFLFSGADAYDRENIFVIKNIVIHTILLTGLFVFPFFKKRQDNKAFSEFFSNVFESLFYSFVFFLSLVILGFLAIFAIETLFSLKIPNSYSNYFAFTLLLSSLYFFSYTFLDFLKKEGSEKKVLSAFSKFFLQKVAFVFVAVYTVILYAYVVKILLISGWPEGVVSSLILAFALLGIVSSIVSYRLSEPSRFVKKFLAFFPYILLPQVFVLFYATYLRVSEYGFTTNRYFLILSGVFLLIYCLLHIYCQRKKEDKLFYFASGALLLLLLLSLFIPKYNIVNYPLESQVEILKEDMQKTGLLKDGRVQKASGTDLGYSGNSAYRSVVSKIFWICRYDCKALEKISFDFDNQKILEKKKAQNKDKKEKDLWKYDPETPFDIYRKRASERVVAQDILKIMDLENARPWYFTNTRQNKRFFNYNERQETLVLNTEGFSKMYMISSYHDVAGFRIGFENDKKEVLVWQNKKPVMTFSYNELLKEEGKFIVPKVYLGAKPNSYKCVDREKYRFCLISANGELPLDKSKDDLRIKSMSGYLLIKE